jgi:hypothetical protein
MGIHPEYHTYLHTHTHTQKNNITFIPIVLIRDVRIRIFIHAKY